MEAGGRRRVVRGAVRRVQHAARARAWHRWASQALVLGPLARSQALARSERATHMQLLRALQRWAGRHRLARAFVGLLRRHALRRAVTTWRAALRTPSVHRLLSVARLRVRHAPSPTLTAFWRCDPPTAPNPPWPAN